MCRIDSRIEVSHKNAFARQPLLKELVTPSFSSPHVTACVSLATGLRRGQIKLRGGPEGRN